MKKLFTLFLAIAASVGTLFASDTQVDGIWYDFNSSDSTASVTYQGNLYSTYSSEYSGEVIIPSSVIYNEIEYNVTSIGVEAFRNCGGLTSVTIPNSVTSIGDYAFLGCANLSSVLLNSNSIASNNYSKNSSLAHVFGWQVESYILGDDVKNIGNYAFNHCESLTSLTIGNNITSIGTDAFDRYNNLKFVRISDITAWCGIKFFNANSNPLAYANHLYLNGQEVTELTIPNGITNIGDYAFWKCSGLTSLSIPNSVTSIGDYAFSDCYGLTSIEIPNSVTRIGRYAFYGGVKYVNINSNAVISDIHTFSSSIMDFFGYQVKEYIIGEDVTAIGMFAFRGCSELTSVSIGSNVTSIGQQAFEDCSSLLNISMDENNAYFSSENGVLFNKDKSLILRYPQGKTEITYSIPNTVTSIENRAFSSCSNLKSVIIPNSVTRIGVVAFSDCTGLTSVAIPSSVTSIGVNAFYNCSNLTTIYSYPSIPPTQEVAFPSGVVVYVPFGKVSTYQQDPNWSRYTFRPMNMVYHAEMSATSAVITLGDSISIPLIDSVGIEGGEQQSGNVLEYIGLEPNSEYKDIPVVLTANTGEKETINVSFTTTALTLTTKEPKAVSSTTALLFAETNMSDAETNCGFEYKRNDAPADMPGTKVFCPVASGQMAGRLKNLKDDVYYKYRAFYQSAAGKMFYGEWQYIFTGDATVEFDPVLYTYSATVVKETEATISGYALAGAADFTEQGFEYWAESRATEPATMSLRKMKNELGEHFFVQASGINMRVTLTNLDAGTVYKYRAYGKVGDQVYYGAEQTFTTRGTYVAPSYLITFVNWDGTELQKSQVTTGTIPEYNGTIPVRPDDDQFTYVFKGWTPELAEVTEDAVYTAEFIAEKATAIDDVQGDKVQGTKVIENGVLYLMYNGTKYNVQGQVVK